MYYINEWSRMDDATQAVILFFLAYVLAVLVTATYVWTVAIKQALREWKRKRSMYYRMNNWRDNV